MGRLVGSRIAVNRCTRITELGIEKNSNYPEYNTYYRDYGAVAGITIMRSEMYDHGNEGLRCGEKQCCWRRVY